MTKDDRRIRSIPVIAVCVVCLAIGGGLLLWQHEQLRRDLEREIREHGGYVMGDLDYVGFGPKTDQEDLSRLIVRLIKCRAPAS